MLHFLKRRRRELLRAESLTPAERAILKKNVPYLAKLDDADRKELEHQAAEVAIRELQHVGFDMKKLSIVGRDYHTQEHAVGFCNAGDRVKYWGKRGAFWGSVFGILFAPAFFWIPGIGPILTCGIIGSMLMGCVEGAAVGAALGGGAGVLAGALTSLGIPKDSVIRYETALKADKFLLIATGTRAEIEQAHAILARLGGQVNVHAQ